jgi:hypothetical protein
MKINQFQCQPALARSKSIDFAMFSMRKLFESENEANAVLTGPYHDQKH